MLKRGKVKPIADLDPAIFKVQRLHTHRLEELAHLRHGRMNGAIREDQPVDAEIHIVDRIAKIAAICPVLLPALVDLLKTLVHPVPDKAALQAGIAFDRLPVFLQVPHRIAHGMGIFAHDERDAVSSTFRAKSTIRSMVGYIGQTRSDTRRPLFQRRSRPHNADA